MSMKFLASQLQKSAKMVSYTEMGNSPSPKFFSGKKTKERKCGEAPCVKKKMPCQNIVKCSKPVEEEKECEEEFEDKKIEAVEPNHPPGCRLKICARKPRLCPSEEMKKGSSCCPRPVKPKN